MAGAQLGQDPSNIIYGELPQPLAPLEDLFINKVGMAAGSRFIHRMVIYLLIHQAIMKEKVNDDQIQ